MLLSGAALAAFVILVATRSVEGFIDLANPAAVCNDTLGLTCLYGSCVEGTCQCDYLWSDNADFVELPDCVTSSIGIWVLWGLNVLGLIWCYYESIGIIVLRFEVFYESRKKNKGYTLFQNKGLLSIIAYFGLSTPPHFIMAILHFIDPDTRIGFDLFPTICFFLNKFGFYLAALIVQGSMFAAALKSDKSQQYLVKTNYIFCSVVFCVSTIVGSLGFITFDWLQSDVGGQIQLMQALYLTQGFALFGQGFGALMIFRKLSHALSRVKDTASGKSEGIRKKIADLQMETFRQGAVQGTIYILLGSIPFFINKHQYFLPISWLAMPLLGKRLAHQFVVDKNAKTIMQRLGIAKTGSSSNGEGMSSGRNNKKDTNGAVNNGGGGNETGKEMITVNSNTALPTSMPGSPTSFLESTNPAFSPSFADYKKKRKQTENQQSSFLSEGTLLEELLDPAHPLHTRFVKFVESRFATNEVALLMLTYQYKSASDSKERTKLGKLAVKDFIEDHAPKMVDLPHDIREILLSTAKRSQWVNTSLDDIRRCLVFDLKGNFLSKFEKQMEVEALKLDV